MKSIAMTCAIVCASLGFCAMTLAQGNSRRDQSEERPRIQQHGPRQLVQRGHQRHEAQSDRRTDHWQDQRLDQRYQPWNDRHEFYNARGPAFRRGGYIPPEFRNRHYFVTDYRLHRLPPPLRGHQWVQVGADYVLIAIATGIIVSIVLGY